MRPLRLLYSVLSAFIVISTAAAQVDYATKIQPIFNSNCVGCHGSEFSGVTLSSYAAVMASVGDQYRKNIVQSGSSATSPLYDKVSSASPQHGSRMPFGGSPLTATQITLIKNWIDQGASPNSTSGVAQRISGAPDAFSLSQNYPNPFNPATKINFTLPGHQMVTLKIYDAIGNQIATLVNSVLEAGAYSIEWNAAGVASGMYFYQIRAFDPARSAEKVFIETKRLVVQK